MSPLLLNRFTQESRTSKMHVKDIRPDRLRRDKRSGERPPVRRCPPTHGL